MSKNPWLKLSAVSFAGIILSFGLLWGIDQFSGSDSNQGIYQNGMKVSMNTSSNSTYLQGNMSMQSNSSGMGMMDNMNNNQNSMGMH